MSLRQSISTLTFALVASTSVGIIQGCKPSLITQSQLPVSATRSNPTPSPVDARDYSTLRRKLDHERTALWTAYRRAKTVSERETILNRARESMVSSVHRDVFPNWYGTQWDFYGTTETPGKGQIACGYFVTTVLRDVGLKVERNRLAQQASENIILSLTNNSHTKRFRQVPINTFVDSIRRWGTGLYVVGLDNHVGFILNDSGDVYFIHSSYADPFSVVKERASESSILSASRYRVLGNLSEDDELILKWLEGDRFVTRFS